MTIIVETGAALTNSNSYVSLAYAQSLAESLGVPVSDDDDKLEAALLYSMAYIETRPYQGHPSTATQALQWPRTLVTANGYPLAPDAIPGGLMKAQVMAAALISTGTDLLPTMSAQFVTEETVGPITTKYSDEFLATFNGDTRFTSIDAYLLPYLIQNGGYKLSKSFGF